MNIPSLIHYCLLYLFACTGLLQAEGFIAGTLVKTPSGHTTIEQLNVDDNVISSYRKHAKITNTTHCTVDCCIKISIDNECIYAAQDQKFYSYDQQKWIAANA